MKGQMIVLKSKPDKVKHIVLDQGRYIIPRKDGSILVGSTMEDVGFDDSIDTDTKQSLFEVCLSAFSRFEQRYDRASLVWF